jgi:hypothetical protein
MATSRIAVAEVGDDDAVGVDGVDQRHRLERPVEKVRQRAARSRGRSARKQITGIADTSRRDIWDTGAPLGRSRLAAIPFIHANSLGDWRGTRIA